MARSLCYRHVPFYSATDPALAFLLGAKNRFLDFPLFCPSPEKQRNEVAGKRRGSKLMFPDRCFSLCESRIQAAQPTSSGRRPLLPFAQHLRDIVPVGGASGRQNWVSAFSAILPPLLRNEGGQNSGKRPEDAGCGSDRTCFSTRVARPPSRGCVPSATLIH